jgi:hypothetical protein
MPFPANRNRKALSLELAELDLSLAKFQFGKRWNHLSFVKIKECILPGRIPPFSQKCGKDVLTANHARRI